VATLLIRIATLWFGVFIGLMALIPMTRRLAALPAAVEAVPAAWADDTTQAGQAWAADPNPLAPDAGRRRSM